MKRSSVRRKTTAQDLQLNAGTRIKSNYQPGLSNEIRSSICMKDNNYYYYHLFNQWFSGYQLTESVGLMMAIKGRINDEKHLDSPLVSRLMKK